VARVNLIADVVAVEHDVSALAIASSDTEER
jgi:hypothetical protein